MNKIFFFKIIVIDDSLKWCINQLNVFLPIVAWRHVDPDKIL